MAWALYTRIKAEYAEPDCKIQWEYRGDRHDLESIYSLSARFDWQQYEFGVRYTKMRGLINVNPNPEQVEVYLQRLPLELDGTWDDYRLPGSFKIETD